MEDLVPEPEPDVLPENDPWLWPSFAYYDYMSSSSSGEDTAVTWKYVNYAVPTRYRIETNWRLHADDCDCGACARYMA